MAKKKTAVCGWVRGLMRRHKCEPKQQSCGQQNQNNTLKEAMQDSAELVDNCLGVLEY